MDNVKFGDDSSFVLDNDLELIFSHPVPHGHPGTQIGYVIMTAVREMDFTFIHCSDVSGPVESSIVNSIIDIEPDLIFLDGPPTHLLKNHLSAENLEKTINNILDIITLTRADIILDHHLLRDTEHKGHLKKVYEHKNRVVTAAEYLGSTNNLLEARREELFRSGGDAVG